jgi:hypothetical protein
MRQQIGGLPHIFALPGSAPSYEIFYDCGDCNSRRSTVHEYPQWTGSAKIFPKQGLRRRDIHLGYLSAITDHAVYDETPKHLPKKALPDPHLCTVDNHVAFVSML